MSLDREKGQNPNWIIDLQHSLDFGGSPWKVEVERVKGIEPSYAAWEAAVLPLNYTRASAAPRQRRLYDVWALADNAYWCPQRAPVASDFAGLRRTG